MQHKEFITKLQEVKRNLDTIYSEFKDHESSNSLYKVMEALARFNVELLEDGTLRIHYDNNIIGMGGNYKLEHQAIVLPLMILYTNFSYCILKAGEYTSEDIYSKVCEQKEILGKAIYQMCTQDFKELMITTRKVREMKRFFKWVRPQLHHIVGPIGEYSERVVTEDAEKLQNIRKTYEEFNIGYRYIHFYDEISGKKVRIPMESPEAAYAITMMFARAYNVTIPWLKEYYPSGEWCPLVPWNVLNRFRMLLESLFF